MKTSTQLLLAASVLPTTLAWGDLGHETIAYIASNLGQLFPFCSLSQSLPFYMTLQSFSHPIRIVTSATETYFQKILGDTSSSYLANVSTWVRLLW